MYFNKQSEGNKFVVVVKLHLCCHENSLVVVVFFFRTIQHSCADQNNHCDMILQYMCGDNVRNGITTQ